LRIVALAYNYKGYNHPPIAFLKDGLIPGGNAIIIPKGKVWAEAELGFIVNESLGVGTYLVANDVTVQIGKRDCHLAESKARYTFCPFKIVWTPQTPNDVVLRTRINREIVQEGNTKDRVLDDTAALAFIKSFMTIVPGDMVLTGTPPHRGKTCIKDGDVVTVEAVGLGSVTNVVRQA
jgi:2-keto-4-pentenoate hydratase/2-oxohepta-3-ene-1,7-dioic acid hydratase in catechol pathway